MLFRSISSYYPFLAIGQQKKTPAYEGKGLAKHVLINPIMPTKPMEYTHEMTTLFSGFPERYSPLKEEY